jgi:hypothetical protein
MVRGHPLVETLSHSNHLLQLVYCNLSIASHGEKMHEQIIIAVKSQNFIKMN